MKSSIKRIFILFLVTVVAVCACGISAFAKISVDCTYADGGNFLSNIIKNVKYKNTLPQTVVDYSTLGDVTLTDDSSEPERVLNIWEYSPKDGTGEGDGSEQEITEYIPLENIRFAIYKVCSLDDYLGGTIKLNTIPTVDEIDKYAIGENHIATIVTDQNGYATYSFGYGENDGVYMIVELGNASIPEPTAPFYVSFPMSNADNTEILYTVNVYPKNDIEITVPVIEVDKDITEIGNKFDSFDIKEKNTWIIRCSIPYDIADAMMYSVGDVLDTNLEYIENSLVVKVANINESAGEENFDALEENKDYIILFETDNGITTVEVSFTEAGMKAVAEAVGDNYADYEVRVYIDTAIKSDAEIGREIENNAFFEYKNSIGSRFNVEVEKAPEVSSGGLNILKVDSDDGKPLAGAVFMIAREATEEDIASGDYDIVNVADNEYGIIEKKVVYVTFFDNKDLSGEKSDSVVTDVDGRAFMYGLAYGNYYLVETNAPAGYNMLKGAVPVIINNVTHLDGNIVKVLNSEKPILPSTEDIGSVAFNMAICVLIGSAVAVVLLSRKKNEKNG